MLTQSSTLGKHEAVVRVLYGFMVDLVPHLTPPLRIFLFGRLASLPFSGYDEQVLQVLYDFTLNALRSSRSANGGPGDDTVGQSFRRGLVMHAPEREWYGLEVLWNFIQDGPGRHVRTSEKSSRDEKNMPSVELTEKAIGFLVSLLNEKEFSGEKDLLLAKCIFNLRKHR